jgi:hypothetical protein
LSSDDDKLDFDLYLVNTSLKGAICGPLAFKKLLPGEFPLRQSIGNKLTHELVFANLMQIEAFLVSNGLSRSPEETNVISQFSLSLMNTGKPPSVTHLDKYERKGRLMKKSMNTDKFKERYFILERQHFCFYKPEKSNPFLLTSVRGQELQHDNTIEV